jgi:hypothetical protein
MPLRVRHLLALGEAIGVVWSEGTADHAGVGRVRGMQVGVAEEDAVWVIFFRIERIPDLLARGAGASRATATVAASSPKKTAAGMGRCFIGVLRLGLQVMWRLDFDDDFLDLASNHS